MIGFSGYKSTYVRLASKYQVDLFVFVDYSYQFTLETKLTKHYAIL